MIPIPGCFRDWISGKAKDIGQIAGTTATRGGYRKICLNYQRYSAHHLDLAVRLWAASEKPARHVDGNPDNNRIENLREANPSQNRMNIKPERLLTSGVKGVSWSATKQKWWVQVWAYGVMHNALTASPIS